jgi:hypothetical protein
MLFQTFGAIIGLADIVAVERRAVDDAGVEHATSCERRLPPESKVGAERFELSTFWSRTKRATRLRYAPTLLSNIRFTTMVLRAQLVPNSRLSVSGAASGRHQASALAPAGYDVPGATPRW